jgi:hypothetical protein
MREPGSSGRDRVAVRLRGEPLRYRRNEIFGRHVVHVCEREQVFERDLALAPLLATEDGLRPAPRSHGHRAWRQRAD